MLRVASASLSVVLALAGPSLRASDAETELALAEKIDQVLEARQRAVGVAPAALANDAHYLRRVYLDLVGRIPSGAEARAFLDDRTADKRRRLVRKLLGSPAYADHFTNVWRDLLLPEAADDFQAQGPRIGFNGWLRDQIARNAGYDRMVRELLTTPFSSPRVRGRMPAARLPEANGPSPVAFYLARDVKAEELAASTARLFLGVRLDCAQCHDHPTGRWTRQQFWGYAAFFAGLQRDGSGAGGPVRELFDRRELRIPGTTRAVEALFLDGTEPRWRFNTGARTTLADWLTSPENPYFARAAANRLWAYFFGLGLVEPVDDLRPDNPPSHPELLDDLARQLAAHHFDIPFLIHTLTTTRAYQRTSAIPARGGSRADADPRLFARKAIKGLTAEQIVDTLTQATGYREPAPTGPGPGAEERVRQGLRGHVLALFRRHGQPATEMQMSVQQALALMNSTQIMAAIRCQDGTVERVAGDRALDTAGRLEALFLAALSRKPTASELHRFTCFVEQRATRPDAKQVLGDVLWVLLNSTEFLLNH